jgi:Protein of unknown function (DUF2442)
MHPLYDVTNFEIIGPYQLRLQFDDGTEQIIDFQPVLYGELFGPLRDRKFFNRVRLDQEVGTLVWPNGADFDPWMLHEWPRLVDALAAQAQTWQNTNHDSSIDQSEPIANRQSVFA